MRRLLAVACLCFAAAVPAWAGSAPAPATDAASAPIADADHRSGREIYRNFQDGLANRDCGADVSTRWRSHFATVPTRLAEPGDELLPLFGYVVDQLRASSLPTEYALIPFVESGYQPGARSPSGPAGMWQMITRTARNHRIAIDAGYDGRLSPVDSTRAAVRYLKTLHGMFAGDWRLAAMAYNAGEYRIFGALKRGGQLARDARPAELPGLPRITHAYVRKIHALSCLLLQAGAREEWLQALERPVPRLEAVEVPLEIDRIAQFAELAGQDAGRLQRLNPAFRKGRIRRTGAAPAQLLAAAGTGLTATHSALIAASTPASLRSGSTAAAPAPPESPRRHTVVRGDNPWTIARRYGIRLGDLLQRNGLAVGSVLQPGKVLTIDAQAGAAE
ncbi:lytic transglycosylase domain-containing protein [Lysobacter sp. D1-1-M9]|uniref:lytic transglycosylase domain-containing protein n=1 Tax=Novilysobacter longmucuonensis TaxID=3098603 RepID=UPI002FCBEADC